MGVGVAVGYIALVVIGPVVVVVAAAVVVAVVVDEMDGDVVGVGTDQAGVVGGRETHQGVNHHCNGGNTVPGPTQ